jgi:hypothetical protein
MTAASGVPNTRDSVPSSTNSGEWSVHSNEKEISIPFWRKRQVSVILKYTGIALLALGIIGAVGLIIGLTIITHGAAIPAILLAAKIVTPIGLGIGVVALGASYLGSAITRYQTGDTHRDQREEEKRRNSSFSTQTQISGSNVLDDSTPTIPANPLSNSDPIVDTALRKLTKNHYDLIFDGMFMPGKFQYDCKNLRDEIYEININTCTSEDLEKIWNKINTFVKKHAPTTEIKGANETFSATTPSDLQVPGIAFMLSNAMEFHKIMRKVTEIADKINIALLDRDRENFREARASTLLCKTLGSWIDGVRELADLPKRSTTPAEQPSAATTSS